MSHKLDHTVTMVCSFFNEKLTFITLFISVPVQSRLCVSECDAARCSGRQQYSRIPGGHSDIVGAIHPALLIANRPKAQLLQCHVTRAVRTGSAQVVVGSQVRLAGAGRTVSGQCVSAITAAVSVSSSVEKR